jgi:hypothetical protein
MGRQVACYIRQPILRDTLSRLAETQYDSGRWLLWNGVRCRNRASLSALGIINKTWNDIRISCSKFGQPSAVRVYNGHSHHSCRSSHLTTRCVVNERLMTSERTPQFVNGVTQHAVIKYCTLDNNKRCHLIFIFNNNNNNNNNNTKLGCPCH